MNAGQFTAGIRFVHDKSDEVSLVAKRKVDYYSKNYQQFQQAAICPG